MEAMAIIVQWVGLYFTGKYPSILIPSYDHGNCSFSGEVYDESPFAAWRPYKNEFNNAVERISAHCGCERNTVEANLRLFISVYQFSLTDAVEALIQAKGNRDEAYKLLKRKYTS
ncbi:unnamed protein product [Rodentolepis nana]|uniref:UBA domain-containing protein n=1 Tax=Rodentolepis nana TaxID=102285 RepID=A0A0R3U0R0_RODNA|nr:unnamed protein product [Rodentolepis nana]